MRTHPRRRQRSAEDDGRRGCAMVSRGGRSDGGIKGVAKASTRQREGSASTFRRGEVSPASRDEDDDELGEIGHLFAVPYAKHVCLQRVASAAPTTESIYTGIVPVCV